ncbi:MAG: single-stranded-DNA-specific exonuclease RecJ [Candidatus Krumholzibacteriia bacterium]
MQVWEIQPADEHLESELSRALLLGPLEARLLASRGVRTVEDAVRFIHPKFEQLHDPFLFNEMERATCLLHEAIGRGERILVHGDYDADGVCGTALLVEVLTKLGADVHFFVPDRAKDGYGLARRVMDRGFEAGLKLVISVDCGSSDREVVAMLAARGVTVLVTDHHETAERIPEAHGFINPKLPGERYPFKELTGAGVAFKLLQGLEKTMGLDLRLEEHLDLVALGTLGDSGALRGENRIIVAAGFELMQEWKRPGLRALRARSGLPASGFSTRQVSFTIIPRLNSPGRIASARAVVELLVTKDEEEAKKIADEIEKSNDLRKELGNSVIDDAVKSAEYRVWHHEPNVFVFWGSDWHQGVVGIAAARLAERYNIPAVLIAVQNGFGKGSVRSAGKVNVKEALERCSEHLLEFGGHKEAGGFSIREEAIPDFHKMFEEVVVELSACPAAPSILKVDAEVSLDECSLEMFSFIERLGPFGMGNTEPVLLIRDLEVLEGTKIVRDVHLKVEARDRSGMARDLIGFSLAGAWKPPDLIGCAVDVLINLRKNVYQGKVESQLQIMAIRLSERAQGAGPL